MPVYVFRCVKCNAQLPACPECKGRKVVPVLSGFFAKTKRKS
jgi:hypothetical protein